MPDLALASTAPIDLSSRAWQLYRLPGCELAADRLNRAADEARTLLRERIAAGATVPVAVEAAWEYLEQALRRDRGFGASDSEPELVGQRLIADWATAITGLPISGENCPALWRI